MKLAIKNGIVVFFIFFTSFVGFQVFAEKELNKDELIEQYINLIFSNLENSDLIQNNLEQIKPLISIIIKTKAKEYSPDNPTKQKFFESLLLNAFNSVCARSGKILIEELPFKEILQKTYGAYLKDNFTTEELEKIIQFLKSPVGRKYQKSALIMDKNFSKLLRENYKTQIINIFTRQLQVEIKKIINSTVNSVAFGKYATCIVKEEELYNDFCALLVDIDKSKNLDKKKALLKKCNDIYSEFITNNETLDKIKFFSPYDEMNKNVKMLFDINKKYYDLLKSYANSFLQSKNKTDAILPDLKKIKIERQNILKNIKKCIELYEKNKFDSKKTGNIQTLA